MQMISWDISFRISVSENKALLEIEHNATELFKFKFLIPDATSREPAVTIVVVD
jgi:hypothetical protein